MFRRLSPAFLLAAYVLACGGTDSGGETPPTATPASECAEGFAPDARGFCAEIVTSEACGPGTRAKIGSKACEPVGWSAACPKGFTRDPSGWGCIDQISTNCTGASRAPVSGGACIDLGDCSAAFPPAGAIVVDDSFTAGQIDATHKQTIGEAIAAAAAGGVIAIEAGTYAEDVVIRKSVKLVGRCAAQVRLESATSGLPGIYVGSSAQGVEIRGLAVVGHVGGINVYEGSQATIEDVLVSGAFEFGIIVDSSRATIRRSRVDGTLVGTGPTKRGGWSIAAGGSSDVTIDDVMVVGGTAAIHIGTPDTIMTVSRLLAEKQAPQGSSRSAGIRSLGKMSLTNVVVRDIAGDAGVVADGEKAKVDANNLVVRNVRVEGSLARGYGVVAFNKGEVAVRGGTIAGAESIALFARDPGSILSAFDVTVIGPPSSRAQPDESLVSTSEGAGMGAQATTRATMNLDGVAMVNTWAFGLYVNESATLDVKRTLVKDMRPVTTKSEKKITFGIALTSNAATTTLEDVVIDGAVFTGITAGRSGTITGKKVYIRGTKSVGDLMVAGGIATGDGGTIDLEGSAIADNEGVGVFASRGPAATVRLFQSTIHGTRQIGQYDGHGVVALRQGTVILDRSAIFGNATVAIAAAGGRARLVGSVLADNPVGVHVQNGSFIVESADDGDLAENEVRVSPDTRFVGNASRIGTGELPLPVDDPR